MVRDRRSEREPLGSVIEKTRTALLNNVSISIKHEEMARLEAELKASVQKLALVPWAAGASSRASRTTPSS
jgi:hypothetical protein